MDTKLKADVAESAVTTDLLKGGFKVLKPIGDRLPYDLALDRNGRLLKIQIKHAWFNKKDSCYIVDARRTKTNRRRMLRARYKSDDFDIAILYIEDQQVFYLMPHDVSNSYASTISLVEADKRQRKPRSLQYRNRWDLLTSWAPHSAMGEEKSVKLGEAFKGNPLPHRVVTPSQSLRSFSGEEQV